MRESVIAVRGLVILACLLSPYPIGLLSAQSSSSPPAAISLTVNRGVPLRLILTKRLHFKLNEPVVARIVDPVFAFDREILPPGLQVIGRITALPGVPWRQRLAAILAGDLTPLREPAIEFDTLVLKDGKRIPLQTYVTPGSFSTIRFAVAQPGKKGRLAQARTAARQQIDTRKRAVIDAVKAPGKMQRLGYALLDRLPYHPQTLAAGTRFDAKLLTPIDFGTVTLPASELGEIGSQPAADSVAHARLSAALSSRSAHRGTPVEAILSQPLYSSDRHLVFPESSVLQGEVVQAKAARRWHRNGQLRFLFQEIEPPASALSEPHIQHVEGPLDSVDVGNTKDKVQMDAEGGTKTVASKKRFIAPAVTLFLAGRGLDNDPVRVHGIATGAHQTNSGGRALSGGVGFGLIGAALGQISRPFAATLGFCGAARSIYTHLIARGQDVEFPANTPIEIRFGLRTGPRK